LSEHVVTPKVSVVLPVYNDRRVCEAVGCLLKQTLPPHEIIVVDDGSTDGTLELLRGFGDKIILIPKQNGGPASARNWGIRAAGGEFVAFTDSDCLPREGWLAGLIGGFDSHKVGGVGGAIKRADSNLLSEYADINRFLGAGISRDGSIAYFATANACFRRHALVEAGLFDERFIKPGGEDVEICYRVRNLGYELRVAENALVLHRHRRKVRTFLKMMANYGEGQYLIDMMHPEGKWIKKPGKEMVRNAIAVRTIYRTCLAYRATHGLKRAALFAFLDHYKHSAFIWGYLRGKRRCSSTSCKIDDLSQSAVSNS
jgi:glycosyltransferase involved in cell wall biosynthesis